MDPIEISEFYLCFWSNRRENHSLSKVLEAFLNGQFGCSFQFVSLNGSNTRKPLAKWIPKLENRDNNKKSLLLKLFPDEHLEMPYANIDWDSDNFIISLNLFYDRQVPLETNSEWVKELFVNGITITSPDFACADTERAWYALHASRKPVYLVKGSWARSSYWLVYYCGDLCSKLGGVEHLKSAPAHEVSIIDNGVVIQASTTPYDNADRDYSRSIEALHDFLTRSVVT